MLLFRIKRQTSQSLADTTVNGFKCTKRTRCKTNRVVMNSKIRRRFENDM